MGTVVLPDRVFRRKSNYMTNTTSFANNLTVPREIVFIILKRVEKSHSIKKVNICDLKLCAHIGVPGRLNWLSV